MAWWVYAGILVANYLYNEYAKPWLNPKHKEKSESELQIPKIAEGASAPLIYGRCRVRSPILVWCSPFVSEDDSTSPSGLSYRMALHCVLGFPFSSPIVKLHNVWYGDMLLDLNPSTLNAWTGSLPAGNPPTESGRLIGLHPRETGIISGYVQLYDGRPNQLHVDGEDPPGFATHLGQAMLANDADPTQIPGYRGYVSAVHFHEQGFEAKLRAQWGASPSLSALSYEVSSYPSAGDALNVGLEANPAEVIIDILTGTFGRLGLDPAKIDSASFLSARTRLKEEGNGYSRAIESGTDASAILKEICEQAGAVLFEDNRDGKIKIKLIRPDYSVSALPHVTTSNCEGLEGFSAAGWEGIPNKVRVTYRDRNHDYQEASATAHNQAVAAAQDNEAREIVLDMPGVCTRELADKIASRELSARSRPLAKCSAIVSRDFYAVNPGDPVKVTWPKYGLDQRVFRVGAVNRGTLENGRIRLELVEDFFFSWGGVLGTIDPGDYGDLPPFNPDPFEAA